MVISEDLFFITPSEMRPFIFAPIWWNKGDLVLQGDNHTVLASPSNVIIKAGGEVSITNAVLYGSKVKAGDVTYSIDELIAALIAATNRIAELEAKHN